MRNRKQSQILTSAVPILGTMGAQSPFFSPSFCDSRTKFLMLSVPNIGNLYSLPGRSHEKKEGGPMSFSKKKEAHAKHGPLGEG